MSGPDSSLHDIHGYSRPILMHASSTAGIWRSVRIEGRRPVLLKLSLQQEAGSPDASILREYSILRGIVSRKVISIEGLESSAQGQILVMEDVGGSCLETILRERERAPLAAPDALEIALSVAEALDDLHLNGIVHGRVEPESIVWNAESREARLMELSSAVLLSDDQVGPAIQRLPALRAHYLAPERIQRPADERDTRSDLYSLGVLLFELLCGRVPFEGSYRTVRHAHQTLPPTPPSELTPELPEAVSDIVLKLIEKRREKRYQSAYGVAADLRRVLDEIALGAPQRFELACQDVPRGIAFSQRLHGRDLELSKLRGVFRRVRSGDSALLFVSGDAGVGKSEFVNSVRTLSSQSAGLVLDGKFAQLETHVPYSALASALRKLAHRLLASEQGVVEAWRGALVRELGLSLGLLVELAPEFEKVLVLQPEIATHLLPQRQNLLYRAIHGVLRVGATLAGSVVLLLDDLQWADVGTLDIVERLAADPTARGTLVIGTYRSNELQGNRALSECCERVRSKFGERAFIDLGPLRRPEIEEFLIASLGALSGKVGELATITAAKTGGNPFFVRQFLARMEREGFLLFDRATNEWTADIEAIHSFDVTDNIVDLMVQAIQSLPDSTRSVLSSAACVGTDFDIAALSAAEARPSEECWRSLGPALVHGMVVPVHRPAPSVQGAVVTAPEEVEARYRFVHDRVQQAAYALSEDAERREAHRRLGLWMRSKRNRLGRQGFKLDAVDQLNRGFSPSLSRVDRQQLAIMNHEAGRRARQSGAYRAAWSYLETAHRLAGPGIRTECRDLAKTLWHDRAEVAILLGRFRLAEMLIGRALHRLDDPVARSEMYNLRITHCTLQNEYGRALGEGRKILADLGMALPDDDVEAALARELEIVDSVDVTEALAHVGERTADSERAQAVLRILLNLQPAAYITQPKLNWWIASRIFNFTLSEGYMAESAKGIANFANVLSVYSGFSQGHVVAKKALELAEREDTRHLLPRIRFTYLTNQHHWFHEFEKSKQFALEVYNECLECGELQYAGYVLGIHEGLNGVFFVDDLVEFEKRLETARAFVKANPNQLALEVIAATRLAVSNLLGKTESDTEFVMEGLSDEIVRQSCVRSGNLLPLGILDLLEGYCHFINGQPALARLRLREAERLIDQFSSSVAYLAVRALLFLVELRDTAFGEGASQIPMRFASTLEFLEGRARDCPQNFAPILELARAELARAKGDVLSGIELYDEAIEASRRYGHVLYEALGNEFAARFWLELGRPRLSAPYVVEAERLFRRWGAKRKAQALRKELPSAFQVDRDRRQERQEVGVAGQPVEVLDLESLFDASLDIASEVSMAAAVDVILARVLEVSGAKRAALYLADGVLRLEATAGVGKMGIEISRTGSASEQWLPPASILDYVRRLQAEVVVDDVSKDERFSRDPRNAARSGVSAACLPITQQGEPVAILYLENDQAEPVFTLSRMKMLRVLSTQAAITLMRAQLLDSLERRVEARTEELAELNRNLKKLVDEQVRELERDRLFRSFLSPPVADLVRSQGGRTMLKSHRQEIAVLFGDLRGFTAFCESVEPEEAIEVLKSYHQAMSRLIGEHEGTLDHRAGDGLMVFFNDPIPCDDPVLRATNLALEMRETMHELCESWKKLGFSLGFGIGIAQGPAAIGLIGVEEWQEQGEEQRLEAAAHRLVRLDYSANGRCVNLASRLCTAAKDGEILVSESVRSALRDTEIRCERRAEIGVKGFRSPVPVFLVEGHRRRKVLEVKARS